jgi:hypothetical protein
MFDELWSEIADAPGEIFDLPELRDLEEGKFDVKEQLRLTEDDLSDLLWLVLNYGDKLEKYPEENQVANLTTKLEKMLNEMG